MGNNIQTIIDKFDKEFGLNGLFCNTLDYGSMVDDKYPEVKQFLKDSLTSMLDGIENKICKREDISYINDDEIRSLPYDKQLDLFAIETRNNFRKEVINIINSHR